MTAFFDGFGPQATIQYFTCLSLSTQGAEPQLATAHDCLWEAKALGSLFFLYYQSTQQALIRAWDTSYCKVLFWECIGHPTAV